MVSLTKAHTEKTFDFKSMTTDDLSLWQQWIDIPHVKEVWFIEGYEPADYVHEKINGNGFDYPFIILLDEQPIGFIQACDLYAYRTLCSDPKGLFTNEEPGTWCMDLFIADEQKLNKGYGTQIVQQFAQKLFSEFSAQKILIDPASSNERAIRCYQKAGFKIERVEHDGVTECTVMSAINSNAD